MKNYALTSTVWACLPPRSQTGLHRLVAFLICGWIILTLPVTAAVSLSWSDNSDNEAGFKIERAIGSGAFGEIATVGANLTAYTDTGVSANTTYTYRVRAYNAAGDSAFSNTAVVTTPPVLGANTAPTISAIADRSVSPGTTSAVITFTIDDAETDPVAVSVTVTTSNTAVVTNAGLDLGGSGASRTLTVTPLASANGTATITITVDDGELTASESFVVTAGDSSNTAPTISNIFNRQIPENGTTGAINFTISDNESAAGSLTVTGRSSDPLLVPDGNITIGGSGGSRTVTVVPARDRSGIATITLTVSDGTHTASDSFHVTVTAASGAPVISRVTDQVIAGGAQIGPITFQVGDGETNSSDLSITASSSNPALVPNSNIVIGGSGSSRTITIFAASNQTGVATITLTVSDGENSSSASFLVAFGADLLAESRVLNLSSRVVCRPGQESLIPGFVISGAQSKRVLLRVVGPTLGGAPFNVAGVMSNPRMTLKRWNGTDYVDTAFNDDWSTAANAEDVRAVSSAVYAFPLADGTRDSALLLDLAPGQYTVLIDSADGGGGVVLVELYDADLEGVSSSLVNLSTRGYVGTGDRVMITGFVVSGDLPKTMLVRAVGPRIATAPFNVPNTVADPMLEIYRHGSGGTDTLVASQDNWSDEPNAAQTALVAQQVYAFPLAAGSKDAALVTTLAPGIYTTVVRGVGGTTGAVLVEVYSAD